MDVAHSYIDTSDMKPRELREVLRSIYSKETDKDGMNVVVYSFGFKHGAPLDADIVIDVRFLPNPFYIPELRGLTGLDKPVSDYVLGREETTKFLDAWENLLSCVMPGYVAEENIIWQLGWDVPEVSIEVLSSRKKQRHFCANRAITFVRIIVISLLQIQARGQQNECAFIRWSFGKWL